MASVGLFIREDIARLYYRENRKIGQYFLLCKVVLI
jgi:hypothetical protein